MQQIECFARVGSKISHKRLWRRELGRWIFVRRVIRPSKQLPSACSFRKTESGNKRNCGQYNCEPREVLRRGNHSWKLSASSSLKPQNKIAVISIPFERKYERMPDAWLREEKFFPFGCIEIVRKNHMFEKIMILHFSAWTYDSYMDRPTVHRIECLTTFITLGARSLAVRNDLLLLQTIERWASELHWMITEMW